MGLTLNNFRVYFAHCVVIPAQFNDTNFCVSSYLPLLRDTHREYLTEFYIWYSMGLTFDRKQNSYV